MFSLKRQEPKPSTIDPLIEQLCQNMKDEGWSTEDYPQEAAALKTLMEAKALEPKPDKISANTLAVIAANLAGIVLILIFERTGIIGTKSLSQVLKPKVPQ